MLFCAPSLYMVYTTYQELQLVVQRATNQSRRGVYQRKVLLASRKATLGFGLGVLLPVFGVIYFCAIQKVFSPDLTYVAFNTYSAFTKVFFASLCMDAHLEISHPAIGFIDKENFSSASRRAFLRYVFHEMRVPLNSISLGLQVLSDTATSTTTTTTTTATTTTTTTTTTKHKIEEEKETVLLMKEASSFMSEILNDVMALQRVEEGSLELVKKPFSLSELFRTLEDSFEDLSKDADVKLYTYIDSSLPDKLIGDKFRIGHVLANLTSNALKFSYPKGKVIMTAVEALDAHDFISIEDDDVERLEEKGTSGKGRDKAEKVGARVLVKFSITDEGRGISEDEQSEDIFTPFRNLKHGDLARSRGSGLGLAICRELVHMHGGKIYYTSMLEKGSTFNVIVPLHIYRGNENLSSPSKLFMKRLHSFRSHCHVVETPNSSPRISPRPDNSSNRNSSQNLVVHFPDEEILQSCSVDGSSRADSTSPMPNRVSSFSLSSSSYSQFGAGITFQRNRSKSHDNDSPSSPFQGMSLDQHNLSILIDVEKDCQVERDSHPDSVVVPEEENFAEHFNAADQHRIQHTDMLTRPFPPRAMESPQILSRVPSSQEVVGSGENKRHLQALVVDGK
ncbi:HAMP domain-containing histidine kinase [archaeon]|nr:MAG: HAMP domain-containing histidine kinase [archaeon]